jgi:hypothetical protein
LICSLLLIPACGWWQNKKDENVETQSMRDSTTGVRKCHTAHCEEKHGMGAESHRGGHHAQSMEKHHGRAHGGKTSEVTEKTNHTNHHVKHVRHEKSEGTEGGVLTPRRHVKRETTTETVEPTMYRGDDKGSYGHGKDRRDHDGSRRGYRRDRNGEMLEPMGEAYDYGYDEEWVEGKDIY